MSNLPGRGYSRMEEGAEAGEGAGVCLFLQGDKQVYSIGLEGRVFEYMPHAAAKP